MSTIDQPPGSSHGPLRSPSEESDPDPASEAGREGGHDRWMEVALAEARQAADHGDVPIGAVVVRNGELLARRHNERELTGDPTAHAEILALRDAAATVGSWHLTDCTLYVTLEPCLMCGGALVNARIDRLVYGAADLKAGACLSLYNVCDDPRLNHRVDVVAGVAADRCRDLLASFFADLR